MRRNNLPLVDIIICTKNNQDIIKKCLDSIKDQSYKKWKCYVVDDNSTDKTREIIKKFSKTECIHLLEEKGPSHNRNVAIKKGNGKYIVTIDSDAVLSQDWLKKMVKFMEENSEVGVCSGKILYMNEKRIINIAGGSMNCTGIITHMGEGKNKDSQEYNEINEVFYLCSASMIMRRDSAESVGLFDPVYFYGYEDLDICWRISLTGKKIVYFPGAESYHEMNTTIKKIPSEKITFLGNRNRMITLLKNYEKKKLIVYSPIFLAHFLFLLFFRKNKMAVINAYLWILKNKKLIKEMRKETNRIRK